MGKKILLADDSITIQKVIELTFSDEDFEVVTVGNGRLAIERLPDVRPDLVLCDIIMPEKDGYEVCDFIKKSPALSHIPVLLLTGAFEPFDQERAARVGCDGFLAKPFEPQTLIAKVKELLARTGPSPAPAVAAPAPSSAPAWSTAMPSTPPPAPAYYSPAPPPPPPPPAAVSEVEPERVDEFGANIGTVRAPAYRETNDDRFGKAPTSLDELYDDDPYGSTDDLLPLSDEETERVVAPVPPPEPAPWAQPTVEVPLEMRAQLSVQSKQLAADRFEEAYEDVAPAPAARETSAAPAPPAPTPTVPPTVERGSAAPPMVKEAFAPPESFRDVAPAPADEQTSITRSVAGEVQVPVDMVEKIAQRVVAQISEKVIREIAWEVIPDLAEALIKREIERLKSELQ